MRGLAPLGALALLAGCEKPLPSEPPPGAFVNENEDWSRDPGPKPVLLTVDRRVGVDGAAMTGVLDLKGPCVGFVDATGARFELVTGAGIPLKYDSMGWFLAVGGDRLRTGASIVGGGGEIARPAGLPAACSGPVFYLKGIARPNPGNRPPPGPVDRSNPGKKE